MNESNKQAENRIYTKHGVKYHFHPLFAGVELATVDAEYMVRYDTYDDDQYCYILARKVGGVTEILLEKRHRINGKSDKDQFEADINKLAELFNAIVNGC